MTFSIPDQVRPPLIVFNLSDHPLRQMACSFNGFFVIVIVKLEQKKTIKKRENRDLRNPGRIARNLVENSIYLVNNFFGHSLI